MALSILGVLRKPPNVTGRQRAPIKLGYRRWPNDLEGYLVSDDDINQSFAI